MICFRSSSSCRACAKRLCLEASCELGGRIEGLAAVGVSATSLCMSLGWIAAGHPQFAERDRVQRRLIARAAETQACCVSTKLHKQQRQPQRLPLRKNSID